MRLMQEMALGKCVLASRVPSLTDYIIDGKNAIMYEPGNSKDCGLKMKMLLENSELINSISEEAPKYLAESCNEKTMALAVEAFLENMLGKR